MSAEDIEQWHPNLAASGYEIKSPIDDIYNCVAFAAASEDVWWEPSEEEVEGIYWPKEVPRTYDLDNFIAVYVMLGYEPCESHDWEPGYEKVAIYAKWHEIYRRESFKHVARSSVERPVWMSKLGPFEDIEHNTLGGLEDPAYGRVVQVLRRLLPIPCEVTP